MTILDNHRTTLRGALDGFDVLQAPMQEAAAALARSLHAGGKMFAAGNGGSAAEAQHLTAELLGRLHPDRERRPLAAVALHADTSTITAVANDYGYDQVFARQVEALGRPEDVLVVLSTSGRSPNLIHAVDTANKIGMTTIGMLGAGTRPLHETCSHVLAVPSDSLPTIQVCHLVMIHVLVELAEDLLFAMEAEAAGA